MFTSRQCFILLFHQFLTEITCVIFILKTYYFSISNFWWTWLLWVWQLQNNTRWLDTIMHASALAYYLGARRNWCNLIDNICIEQQLLHPTLNPNHKFRWGARNLIHYDYKLVTRDPHSTCDMSSRLHPIDRPSSVPPHPHPSATPPSTLRQHHLLSPGSSGHRVSSVPPAGRTREGRGESTSASIGLDMMAHLQRSESSIVKTRSGSVLSRGFILKTDHYPSGTPCPA